MAKPTRLLALLASMLIVSCDGVNDEGPLGPLLVADEVVFLAQTVIPDAVMDALYQGRLVLDGEGCIRLDSVDDATVVWPKDFRFDRNGGMVRILDSDGDAVGAIGGRFRLGGGEVDFLHAGIPVSAADRERAHARCPGKFWIVGDVLRVN